MFLSSERAFWQWGVQHKTRLRGLVPGFVALVNLPLAPLEDDGTHARPQPTARVQKKTFQEAALILVMSN